MTAPMPIRTTAPRTEPAITGVKSDVFSDFTIWGPSKFMAGFFPEVLDSMSSNPLKDDKDFRFFPEKKLKFRFISGEIIAYICGKKKEKD